MQKIIENPPARGIRGALRARPQLVLAAIVVVALAAMSIGLSTAKKTAISTTQIPRGYYTCDDGITLFQDAGGRLTPFVHDGREAVSAHVAIGADGKPTVLYLSKRTDGAGITPQTAAMGTDTELVKRPGESTWVRLKDPKAAAIVSGQK